MVKLRHAVALAVLTWSSTLAATQAPGVPGRVVPLKRGDSTGTEQVLRELYVENLPATRVQLPPVQWLPGTRTDVYRVSQHYLQFHHYPSPAAASSAKTALLKRLRVRQARLAEPSQVTRCGSDLVLEFGEGGALIGSADENCEYPIDVRDLLRVERNRSARTLLDYLSAHRISVRPMDTWEPLPELGPGFAYQLPSGFLYVHASQNQAAAGRARIAWIDQTPSGFPQHRQWAYRCGAALVVYDERRPSNVNALIKRRCGAPLLPRAILRDS